MNSMLLMEPFRTALLAQAVEEGLITLPSGEAGRNFRERLTQFRPFQSEVLKLSLFAEEISIIHYEEEGEQEEFQHKGLETISWLPLGRREIVAFKKPKLPDLISKEPTAGNSPATAFWVNNAELISTLEPIIVSQLMARYQLPHPSVFNYIRALRTGSADKGKIVRTIPHEFVAWVESIQLTTIVDGLVFTTVVECLSAKTVAETEEARIAMADFAGCISSDIPQNSHTATESLFKVLLSEVTGAGFDVPVPSRLSDLPQFRQQPEVAAFRTAFSQWLQAISSGRTEAAEGVRKEIRSAVRHFKSTTRIEKLGDWVGWLAIPAGILDPKGAIGLKLIERGTQRLAKWLRRKHAWVAFCGQSRRMR